MKNNNLTHIDTQCAFDNLPMDRLKHLRAEIEKSPVNKFGIQFSSTGIFIGFEGGQYERQVVEMELYKD